MRTRVAIFRGESEAAQLELIFQVTGYPQSDALKQYELIEQWPVFSHICNNNNTQNTFLQRFGSGNKKVLEGTGLDLLQRLLDINPSSRITATEALKHEYFHDVVDPSQ